MNDYRYHYMFTTFVSIFFSKRFLFRKKSDFKKQKFKFQDIETFDLEDFKYNSVNITAFRLVDTEDPRVSGVLDQMEKFQPIGHAILNKSGIIQVREKLELIFFPLRHQKDFKKIFFLFSGRACTNVRFGSRFCERFGRSGSKSFPQAGKFIVRARKTLERRPKPLQLYRYGEFKIHCRKFYFRFRFPKEFLKIRK